jgi:hypothetical protein
MRACPLIALFGIVLLGHCLGLPGVLIAVSGEWLPVEVVMFDHSNCVERAFCFALPASSAGIDITDHARLYPSNWFETEKMERARRDAPAAPGAASQINLWQQIKTFDWHLAI